MEAEGIDPIPHEWVFTNRYTGNLIFGALASGETPATYHLRDLVVAPETVEGATLVRALIPAFLAEDESAKAAAVDRLINEL